MQKKIDEFAKRFLYEWRTLQPETDGFPIEKDLENAVEKALSSTNGKIKENFDLNGIILSGYRTGILTPYVVNDEIEKNSFLVSSHKANADLKELYSTSERLEMRKFITTIKEKMNYY